MANWFFPPVLPFRVQGRGLADDNFASEDRKNEEIMGREGFQNPLDARSSTNMNGAVAVALDVLDADQFDTHYLKSILTSDYISRLKAAGADNELDFSQARVLIVEDFGTTGLIGNYQDSNADGAGENWNAFWFREGEGAKSGLGSNGRAGQGKITLYRASRARAVFGLTVRESDRRSLLMGRSSFRRSYNYGSEKFERDAFWCIESESKVLPIEDKSEIETFRRAFGLGRTVEPGLSLVIPFVGSFDLEELLKTAIGDFYLPIVRGRLEVRIGGEVISKDNIDSKAEQFLPDLEVRERRSSFTKGFRSMVREVLSEKENGNTPLELKRGWERATKLTEEFLPEGKLEELRTSLENGEKIAIRCPVAVRPKKAVEIDTYFDVHLTVPENLDRVEEAYIRRDLLIGSEAHLSTSSHLPKARCLTLIEDEIMSAFLADAEEPTHLRWNASRPRLSEDYKTPKELVRAVRQASSRILTLLSGSDVARDIKALSKYFAKPAETGQKRTPGGNNGGSGTSPTPPNPPEPPRRPISLVTGDTWIAVRPKAGFGDLAPKLPLRCELELAYEGLDLDPFDAYDPFDFDLNNRDVYPTSGSGVTILDIHQNKIEFEITDTNFELKVDGFDPKIRLRGRLTYNEKNNGTNIDPE